MSNSQLANDALADAVKNNTNPWRAESDDYKGTERTDAMAAWITRWGIASANRCAASAGMQSNGKPLRKIG